MLSAIRRLKSDEQGQAIIIAAVGLLIMAVGVLATAQMGFAIFEKQKLQTIADNTAYSLATMQARAFNFFAFTNRAMVVHYVAMMHMQGIISFLTLLEAVAGTAADVLFDVYGVGCCPPYDDFGCWAMAPFQIAEQARGAITQIIDALDPIAKQATDALYQVNEQTIYRLAQQVFKYTMYLVNGTGMLQVSQKSDPDIDLGVSRLISGIVNMVVWAGLFDSASESLPKPTGASDDNKKAQRLATEIANATRAPAFVPARDLMGGSAFPSGGISGSLSAIKGQSKFITDQKMDNIEKKQANDSELAQGVAMSSIDTAGLTPGGGSMGSSGFGGLLSITVGVEAAPNQNGKHKRYVKPTQTVPTCGQIRSPFVTNNVDYASNDQNHNNWKGPAPFMSLKPKNVKDWKKDFGQPGVFIWLNKKTDKLVRPGLTQKFRIDAPTWQSEIDTRIGEKGLLTSGSFTGLNAIAAAQVYYHRPGNWREMPNLFNPYWKARLYPVTNYVQFATGNGMPPIIATLIQNMLMIH